MCKQVRFEFDGLSEKRFVWGENSGSVLETDYQEQGDHPPWSSPLTAVDPPRSAGAFGC